MAITQVGTATTGSDITGASASVAKPSGVTEGDVLVASMCTNEDVVPTPPSGFTVLYTDDATTNLFRTTVYYRVCGPSEPSSYTWTKTADGAPLVVVMSAWRGVDNANPFEDISGARDNGLSGEVNPNPPTAFTQEDAGRLFYIRSARSTGSAALTFTNPVHSANWGIVGQTYLWSGGSPGVNYGQVHVFHLTDTAGTGGNRSEPAIPTSKATTDNMYLLGCMRAAPDVTGTVAAELPKLTSSFAGNADLPQGSLTAQTPKITSSFTATGAPPEGALAAALPKVSATFQASGVGGGFTSTLPSIHSEWEGGVEPIGPFELTLPSLTSSFTAETSVFGEHVIRVEREDRAFRVVDDGITSTGLKPIKRSRVTDA